MKVKKVFAKAFGLNEFGLVDFPKKISNVQVARIELGDKMGCARCFPHGFDTYNATFRKNRKSWKFQRRKQYRAAPSCVASFVRGY